jgi:predicted exporter
VRNLTKSSVFYCLQLTFVLILGLYLLFFGRWQLETNLLSILPNSAKNSEMLLAEQAIFSDKQNQVVIIISGENAVTGYNMLQQSVEAMSKIELIEAPQPSITTLAEFYLPYRHNFLSKNYLNALDDELALTQLVTAQLTQLATPFVSATLAEAPRLNLAHYLQEALTAMGDTDVYRGIPAIINGEQIYLISQLKLNVNGFSLKESKQVATQLQQLFEKIEIDHSVNISYSGILFHTAESTTQAKQEISMFGTLSMLTVVLLLLAVFRSISPLIVALTTVTIASFYGITAILLFFDKLHMLTLVFAVTLIGIVIDYCFHFFVYAAQKKINKQKSITKPLVLSFLTTVLGYFALIFSPLDMLSQVAVFMIFGLLGALLTVLILLPNIPQLKRVSITANALSLSVKSTNLFNQLLAKRTLILLSVFVSLSVLFITQPITFNDDVRLLNSSPTWLIHHEEKVAKVFKYKDVTRIIVKANTPQKLLEKQEYIIEQLQTVQPSLLIKSITDLLPSIKRQKTHFYRLKGADEQGQFNQAMAITGLADPISLFKPLTFEKFTAGPLSQLSTLYVAKYPVTQVDAQSDQQTNSHDYSAWLEVSGKLSKVNDEWLNNTKNVAVFDKAIDVSAALAQYRQSLLWLLIIGFAVVTVMQILKFGVRAGGVATFITVGSGLTALIISQLVIGHLNLFNLLAVLLILALAIDYVIFYQEHGLYSGTFLAITLSALSSALVFGMLIFSKTPAVNSFGLTVMIGIIAIFILAPLSSFKNNN